MPTFRRLTLVRMSVIATAMAAILPTAPYALAQCAIWAPLTNISRDVGHYAVDGNLAIDPDGAVHLVYQSFLDSYGAAFYTTNRGGTWSTPLAIGSFGGKGSAPKIVVTPDNMLHAFYGKGSLFWRTKPLVGGAWSTPVQVDVNPGGGSFIQQVAVDSFGGIYFMYGHLFDSAAPARNGIYGRYKPLGGAWGATELIYGNSDDANWPRGDDLAARGTTLWVSIGVDGHAYYKKKSSTGAWPAGKGTRLVSGAGGLRFAFNPVADEVVALYGQGLPCTDPCEDDPWFEIFARYSYDDGATWSPPENVSAMTEDIDRTPSAAYDALGNLHVVWEGFCCDHKVRMRYRGRVRGIWDPVVTRVTGDVGGHIPNSIAAFGTSLFFTFSDNATGIGLYDVVFTTASPSQPRIEVTPASLARSIVFGEAPADDTLSLRNACVGTLTYSVSEDGDWLAVAPASGSCESETDAITVTYPGAATLPPGEYSATITVSGTALNSPVHLPVWLAVRTVPSDFDDDRDVDLADFALFQMCFNGPNQPPAMPAACVGPDLDADGDVDLLDFAAFQTRFNGPNRLPACSHAG